MPDGGGHAVARSSTARILELILGAGILFFLAHAVARAFVSAPEVYLFPLTEDGYYSLTVARNLAEGRGPTVDGRSLTNGFQPLWVLLITPVFALARHDTAVAVRGVLVVHWVVYVATLTAVAAIATRVAPGFRTPPRVAALVAVLLYVTNITAYELHFNGLETGLVLLLHALLVLVLLRIDWSNRRHVATAGVLAGILVLTRLDAVFLAGALVICPLLQGVSIRRTLTSMALVWAVTTVIAAPWLLFNVVQFGTLMPSSGLAQQDWAWRPGRIAVALAYAAGHAIPLSTAFCFPSRHETAAALIVLGAAGVAAARLAGRLARGVTPRRSIGAVPAVALVFAFEAIALATWYGASSFAWWMFQRYTAPLLVCSVPALAIAAVRLTRAHPGALGVLASVCVGFAVLGLWGATTAEFRERSHVEQVRIANAVARPEEWVGALQSGTLGFFRPNVLNLDGKVNAEALRAAGALDRYAREAGVTWLIDWPGLLHGRVFQRGLSPGWRLERIVQIPGCTSCRFAVYRYDAFAKNKEMPYP